MSTIKSRQYPMVNICLQPKIQIQQGKEMGTIIFWQAIPSFVFLKSRVK
jgi:hypothetical protein